MSRRSDIEELLAQGIRQKEIARRVGCSEAYVSKVKNQVKKSVKKQVNLTNEAPYPLSPAIPLTPLQAPATLKLRLHRFYYSKQILNAISEDRLVALQKNDRLNNVTQWLGAGFRITQGTQNKVLEIEGLELLSDYRLPVPLLRAQATSMAENACTEIARAYGLMLAKEAYEPPKLTEIELNATQMTERLRKMEKKGVLPLYKDEQGYAIWADWSYGIGGMESNSPVYLQRISDMAKDLAEQDGWQQMKGNLAQAIGLVKYYAENMESHAKLVKEAAKLIKELRHERKMSSRAKQDGNQMRLTP